MASVDPDDDGMRRFVVQHYRYDPQRHERRHVVVAAFDNAAEFKTCLQGIQTEIERRRSVGEPVDQNEHASGTVREPGHQRLAANGRLVMRAFQHGVTPGPWLDDLELPRNIAVMHSDDGDGAGLLRRFGRRLRVRLGRGPRR